MSQNILSLKVLEAYTRDVGSWSRQAIDYDSMDSLRYKEEYVYGSESRQAIDAKLLQPIAQSDKAKNCATDQHTETTYKTYLTHFACGHVTVLNNGTTLRKFTLIADDFNGTGKPIVISTNTYGLGKPLTSSNQKYKPVIFHAWTFNGTVPVPTMRFTQGDHVQITVINAKDSEFPHSLHMHSIHPGAMDGMSGAAGMIEPGKSLTYSFVAQPAGVYPYHKRQENSTKDFRIIKEEGVLTIESAVNTKIN